MHPIRELPRPRPRARLPRTRPSLRRGPRDPARLPDRSARELAAVAAVALAAGAALEFFLDPRNGKRRRHLVHDRTRAAFRRQTRKLERQAHYEAGKIVGVTHAITHHAHASPELDDVSLVRKVESELFRDRTIPKGPISINADRGIVSCAGSSKTPSRSNGSSATCAGSRASSTSKTCSTRRASRRRQAVHTATRARRPGTSRPTISDDDEGGRRSKPLRLVMPLGSTPIAGVYANPPQ